MWLERMPNTLWAAFPVVLAVLAVRPVSRRQVRRFVDRYGVAASSGAPAALSGLILRNRASRLIGAAIGCSLPSLAFAIGIAIPNAGEGILYGVSGYLIGAFVAALLPTQPATRQRRASLVPRRSGDYLPRLALITPAVAIAVSVAASIVYLVEPRRAIPTFFGAETPIGGLVLAVVAGAATVIAVRIVVARPQPLNTPELAAVDDAVRTQALHTLTGAGLAVALTGTGSCLFDMGGFATNPWFHSAGWVGGGAALVGALIAWLFRSAPWRVSRYLPS
jgi:hypothetical protein